jgi:hypothetical protein
MLGIGERTLDCKIKEYKIGSYDLRVSSGQSATMINLRRFL